MDYKYQNEVSYGMVIASREAELGFKVENVLGENPDIGTSFEEVWDEGGTYTFIPTAAPLYLSSSNNGDTQVVVATLLDEDWNEVEISTTLTGQTPIVVTGGANYIRVNKLTIASAPAGDVYIAQSDTYTTPGIPDTATKIHGKILTTELSTKMAIRSVPVGKGGFVYELCLDNLDAIVGNADILIREFGSAVWEWKYRLTAAITILGGCVSKTWKFPLYVPPKGDVVVRMKAASGTIVGHVTFEFIIKPVL